MILHPKRSGVLFAAALVTSGFSALVAGEPDAKSVTAKTVIETAPPHNPLCFLDDTLCFDVHARARWEIQSNTFDFNDALDSPTDDNWLLLRLRIGALWKPAPWLKIYAQGQDAREWLSERPDIPGVLGSEGDDSFDLRQAYVELGPFEEVPITLRVGRQVLIYGDERLIGVSDWNNFSRTFDAVKLIYKHEKFQLDLFTSSVVVINRSEFNKSDLFNGNENDRQLVFSGAYLSTGEVAWGMAEAYLLWLSSANGNLGNVEALVQPREPKGAQSGAQHSSFGTIGGRLKGDPKRLQGFDFEVEAAYQNGQVRDAQLNAFAVHVGGGYHWLDTAWKPRLWAEYNYASGDRDPFDDNTETFQNLFPSNHKFYGYMDLFALQNVHNALLSTRLTPLKNVTVQLDYHAFWLASTDDFWYRSNGVIPVRPLDAAAREASNFAGQEIDLTVTWNVNKNVQLQAGYSHFFAGDYLDDTGAGDDADFGYVMATVNF